MWIRAQHIWYEKCHALKNILLNLNVLFEEISHQKLVQNIPNITMIIETWYKKMKFKINWNNTVYVNQQYINITICFTLVILYFIDSIYATVQRSLWAAPSRLCHAKIVYGPLKNDVCASRAHYRHVWPIQLYTVCR